MGQAVRRPKPMRSRLLILAAAVALTAWGCRLRTGALRVGGKAKLRVMTYNILDGGGDRIELLQNVMAQQKPDILAMNECSGWHRDNAKLLRSFMDRLDMNGFLAIKHGHNVVILARRDLAVRQVLSDTERQGRGLLVLEITAPDGKPLKVLATHMIHTNPDARLKELKEVVRYIGPDERCIVLGDLNSISPRDTVDLAEVPEKERGRFSKDGVLSTAVIQGLESAGMVDAYCHTHPSSAASDRTVGTEISKDPAHAKSHLRLDYIFVSSNLVDAINSVRVIQTEETNRASDHFPVVLDLKF